MLMLLNFDMFYDLSSLKSFQKFINRPLPYNIEVYYNGTRYK